MFHICRLQDFIHSTFISPYQFQLKNHSAASAMILHTFLLALQQMNHAQDAATINKPMQDLFQTVKPSDLQLIIQSPPGRNPDIIDEVHRTVPRTVPITCVSLNDSIPSKLPPFARPSNNKGTLILYLYVSKSAPDYRQSSDIIRVIVRDHNRPKVLLITILEEQSCNFKPLLKQMWREHFIDVTILELSRLSGRANATKVHQYNPFTNVYSQQPYRSGVQWFPNNVTNLHGYPIQVLMRERPGHLYLERNSRGYPVVFAGPDVETLKVLARVMNFTIEMLPNVGKETLPTAVKTKFDIFIPMLPFFPDSVYTATEHTLPLHFESWCPLVPITYKYKNFEARALIGIAINCSLVLVFWAISIVLKFDSRSWPPQKIFGLIISAAMPMKPRKTIERIAFMYLILVSAAYSANLHADLATASLEGETETDYNSYEELNESGLKPVVLDGLFNVTFITDDESFLALRSKTLMTTSTMNCTAYLAEHRNVTCFLETRMALASIYSQMRQDKATTKICETLCYANPPAGYILGKPSLYRDQFVEIIIRLECAGIRNKWMHDHVGRLLLRKTYAMNVNSLKGFSLASNLIYIAERGYFASSLVLLGEMIVHRMYNGERGKNV